MLRAGYLVCIILGLSTCASPYLNRHNVIQLKSDSSDVNTLLMIKPYRDSLQHYLKTFICVNTEARLKTDSLLAKWMAQALLNGADADHTLPEVSINVVLLNKGSIRSGLPKDSLKIDHFYKLMPFENTITQGLFKTQSVENFLKSKNSLNFFLYTFVRYNNQYIEIALPQIWNIEMPVRIISSNFVFDGGDGFNITPEALNLTASLRSIRSCLIEHAKTDYSTYKVLKWPKHEP